MSFDRCPDRVHARDALFFATGWVKWMLLVGMAAWVALARPLPGPRATSIKLWM